MSERYTLFDTPIGRCGIAWGDAGVVGLALPGPEARMAAWATRRHAGAVADDDPPATIRAAIAAVRALLAGGRGDLAEVALDMGPVPDFARRVYDVARTIPPGRTLTYGDVAARIGAPGEARAVGEALGRNPFPIVVPCHRVVAADGRPGGFSAPGGSATKMRMLAIEGAPIAAQAELFAP